MESHVLQLLARRHASRAIAPRPIDPAIIDELVDAARLAPSCFNKQPWRFLVLVGDEALAKGRAALSASNAVWAARAPVLIATYARRDDDCVLKDGRAYYHFDTGLAVMNLMLAATERGLTARPMAGFRPAALKEAFALADADEPVVMLAVGYPDDDESHLPEEKRGLDAAPRARKAAGEIARVL
jgi:nitroreductase